MRFIIEDISRDLDILYHFYTLPGPSPWVENPASLISEAMGDLHGYIMVLLTQVIVVCVTLSICAMFPSLMGFKEPEAPEWLVIFTMRFIDRHRSLFERLSHHLPEILMISYPVFLLLFLSIPALHLLFITEESEPPVLTVKVVAHQWYWSYEVLDLAFESYIIPDSELEAKAHLRGFSTDSVPSLPTNIPIRFLVTSEDVLHSWAVPSLGVKVDAVPGRLNQVVVRVNHPGTYYGQCSELCGTAHGFMPIELKFIPI